MDGGDIFDILPALVRSRISAFGSSRWSRRHSVSSSRHHQQVTRQIAEELLLTGVEGKGLLRADDTITEAGMEASTRYKKTTRSTSGIRWRYAEQGISMHARAHREKEDANYARRSYIDGAAYTLLALPEDLTEQEAAVIRDALSPSIVDMILLDSSSKSNSNANANARQVSWKPPPANRTVLQRYVASLVAVSVVLLHWALSFAGVVIRFSAEYERKHNISQRLATWGFVAATAVGRYGVVLGAKVCAMKNGSVGRAVSYMADWAVEGVAYGIQEGIGQGLLITADPKSKQA